MNDPSTTAATQAVDLARRFIEEVWNRTGESSARDLLPTSFGWPEDRMIGPTRVSGMGIQSLELEITANRRACPDFAVEVTGAFSDGPDRAVVHWRATGTHTEPFRMGNQHLTRGATAEPTSLSLVARGWTLVQATDGRIRPLEHVWHPLSLLEQIAVVSLGVDPRELLGLA